MIQTCDWGGSVSGVLEDQMVGQQTCREQSVWWEPWKRLWGGISLAIERMLLLVLRERQDTRGLWVGNSHTSECIFKHHFKGKYFENTICSQNVTVGTGSTSSGYHTTCDSLTEVVVVEVASRSQIWQTVKVNIQGFLTDEECFGKKGRQGWCWCFD